MTITNPTSYTKDTDPWVHSTFVVSLGIDYSTYVAIVNNNCRDELYGNGVTPVLESNMATVLASAGQDNGPLPVFFSHSKCRDTSLGGNDAINCYYQYNETDDPPHPFTSAENNNSSGMGRVYSETIDDHQQILYLSFGIPMFNNLSSFYDNAVDANMAEFVNSGTSQSLLSKLSSMASASITALVQMPVLAIPWLRYILGSLGSNTRITKYYDFSSRMDMYYKYVQTILTHISVNMGFMNDANLLQANPALNGSGGVTSDGTVVEQAQSIANQNGTPGIPDLFKTFHMDIYQIMLRRASFLSNSAPGTNITTDSAVYQMTNLANAAAAADGSTNPIYDINSFTPLQSVLSGFSTSIYNAMAYIGFRIEKSTESSESINNQIGPSEIAGLINSKTQAARETRFSAMSGRTGNETLDAVGDFIGGLANGIAQKIGNTKGIEGLTALATGSGMVDIPEVWKDSSISKNYSFNIKLRSPYGDPFSIMQSLYVPLALILAASMSRAIGTSSYSTPFICRAYCKGMFAVPLGMFESVTIKRGNDTNGWNYERLPTEIDVSFTIKDLSPCMYMAMGDLTSGLQDLTDAALLADKTSGIPVLGTVAGGFSATAKAVVSTATYWNAIFGTNSSFQEYLLTLSGMGLAERTLWILTYKRKMQLLNQTAYNLRLNPNYWALTIGSSVPMRLISAISPTTKLPQN